jgi:hypothetical protein
MDVEEVCAFYQLVSNMAELLSDTMVLTMSNRTLLDISLKKKGKYW